MTVAQSCRSEACDYVYFNLRGAQGARSTLPKPIRAALDRRQFVHWVDPCVLTAGHRGEHVLTTMPDAR